MQCMKCGKPMGEPGVFCAECRAVMDRYPVKLKTKVVIPGPKTYKRANRPIRRQRSLEDIVLAQKQTIRRLLRVIALLSVLLALSLGVIAWRLYQEQKMAPLGSNYSTVTETSQP